MISAKRAGLAGATLFVAAAGAAVGVATDRLVVTRHFRRRVGSPPGLRLGQLRGPSQLVRADDGVEIYVEVDEPSNDTSSSDLTVVFVHGYALNQDCFHFQRQALRGSARLVLFDQRSHGRSGKGAAERATIDQLARDLEVVIDNVAPQGKLVLIGHSMGGMAILGLAQRSPKLFGGRVVAVALLSTSAGKLAEVTLGLPVFAARTLRHVAPRILKLGNRTTSLLERGRALSGELATFVTRIYAFAGSVPGEVVDFSVAMINATPLDVLADFYPTLNDHHSVAALPALHYTKTLVLVGEQDLMTPSDHSREMVACLPAATLVILDPGGHLVMLERPDDVNAELFSLIDRARDDRHV